MCSSDLLTHIPYKTSPVLDAASGALQLAYVVGAQGLPLLKAGKVKLITLISPQRFRAYPEVPTVPEVLPNFESPPQWTALIGPAGLPSAIVRRVFDATVKGLSTPEGRQKVMDVGFEPMVSKSTEEFAATVKAQIELVGRILNTTGLKLSDQ